MNMPICGRCKKNVAVVFVTRMEGDKTQNEGLCLKCAKELGIQPVTQMLQQFGVTDEDLDTVSEELMNGGGEMLQNMIQQMTGQMPELPQNDESDSADEEEEAASRAPSLNLFQIFRNQKDKEQESDASADKQSKKSGKKEPNKKKFLSSYAQNLTQQAKDG